MFADASNASKVAFATLIANLLHWGFELVDCQSHTSHLEAFGAEDCAAIPPKKPWPTSTPSNERPRHNPLVSAILEKPEGVLAHAPRESVTGIELQL